MIRVNSRHSHVLDETPYKSTTYYVTIYEKKNGIVKSINISQKSETDDYKATKLFTFLSLNKRKATPLFSLRLLQTFSFAECSSNCVLPFCKWFIFVEIKALSKLYAWHDTCRLSFTWTLFGIRWLSVVSRDWFFFVLRRRWINSFTSVTYSSVVDAHSRWSDVISLCCVRAGSEDFSA